MTWRRFRSAIALAIIVGACAFAGSAVAQFATRDVLLQSAVSAIGNGTAAIATGYSLIGVQVTNPSGTPTFTIQFSASIDGSTYVATACRPVGGGALVTTASAPGAWRCNVAGAKNFRAHITAYTGPGTITAVGSLTGGGLVDTGENVPDGSQTVNQGGTWTVQAAHQGGVWNVNHVSSVTHVGGVVAAPFYWQAHTYSQVGQASTVATTSGPTSRYALQVGVTRGSATGWYVHLTGSLDGNVFTKITAHEQSTGDGVTVFTTASSPARYFRSHLFGYTGDGLLMVHVLGMQ